MSVAILLITHENIGNNMLNVTGAILNSTVNNTACVEIPMDADTGAMQQHIVDALNGLSTDEGVLIVTDSYGSTPCNVATEFIDRDERTLVSGLNLPMLIRIMNYRSLPLDELRTIAIDGGVRGITASTE